MKGPAFDLTQKKFVFKLVNDSKDRQNKTEMDVLWRKYMGMAEKDTRKKGTNEAIVASKEELVQIVEELERDNLVMYDPNDGSVIMI